MYSEFATDPKVQMMSEAMQRRLTMLFCLKNSNALRNGLDNDSNENSNDEVAFMLRINDAELSETKALFISKGFIDSDWNLLNWDKRQFISDVDPTRAERQKRYREKHSNALRNAPVTPLDTDTDTEQNINNLGDEKPIASKSKGKSLPNDWVLPKAWGEWAKTEKPNFSNEQIRLIADIFKDHWLSNSNQANAKKSDWEAAWRNWIRKQSVPPTQQSSQPDWAKGML
jgi:hypothetical protein